MVFPQDSYLDSAVRGMAGAIADTVPPWKISAVANGAIVPGNAVVLLPTDSAWPLVAAPPPAPGAADADAFIVTGVSTAGEQVYEVDGAGGLDLDGAVGGEAMAFGRPVQATFNNHADWDATTMVIQGYDAQGRFVVDTITIPNAGNNTVLANLGVPFAIVTRVFVPTQSGTNGTFTLGYQADIPQVVALGIAVANQALQTANIADGDAFTILRKGHIWVVSETDVLRGQKAWVRATAAGLEVRGALRVGSDGGDAGVAPNLTFLTDADAGDPALLEVA